MRMGMMVDTVDGRYQTVEEDERRMLLTEAYRMVLRYPTDYFLGEI